MWRPYVDLAQTFFPNAKIIIDKYHFIRQITWAIENVRKRLQKSMPASLRKYYKRSHKLILSRYQSLSTENKQACDLMLLYSDETKTAAKDIKLYVKPEENMVYYVINGDAGKFSL